jgi:hypothetical protein
VSETYHIIVDLQFKPDSETNMVLATVRFPDDEEPSVIASLSMGLVTPEQPEYTQWLDLVVAMFTNRMKELDGVKSTRAIMVNPTGNN